MFKEQLANFGLTKTQSAIMDYLFEYGEAKASDIAKKIGHPRGVVYKSLEELLTMELVEKIEKDKKIARFRPAHPGNMEKLLEIEEKRLNQNKKMFAETLPQLVSSYNLAFNKPGIRFFEGEEGMKKVLDDTLTSKTEICLFMNHGALLKEKEYSAMNNEYIEKRKRLGVIKKIIEAGKKPEMTFGTVDDKYDAITQIKYIHEDMPFFKSAIQIYDGKISYQMIDGGNVISIIIQDKNIYEMHKAWFEYAWNKLEG